MFTIRVLFSSKEGLTTHCGSGIHIHPTVVGFFRSLRGTLVKTTKIEGSYHRMLSVPMRKSQKCTSVESERNEPLTNRAVPNFKKENTLSMPVKRIILHELHCFPTLTRSKCTKCGADSEELLRRRTKRSFGGKINASAVSLIYDL